MSETVSETMRETVSETMNLIWHGFLAQRGRETQPRSPGIWVW